MKEEMKERREEGRKGGSRKGGEKKKRRKEERRRSQAGGCEREMKNFSGVHGLNSCKSSPKYALKQLDKT